MTAVRLAAAILPLVVVGTVAADQVPSRLADVRAALLDIRDGNIQEPTYGKESPRVLELYARAWALARASAVSFLRRHPAAIAAELAARLERLNPREADKCIDESLKDESGMPDLLGCFRLRADGVRFSDGGRSSYALALLFGERGRVLVVSRVGRLAEDDIMPLGSGSVSSLPDDRKGRHRFYIDSRPGDLTPLGCLTCRDLTVWQWDGRRLVELVRKNYRTPKNSRVRWDGRYINVETRGAIRTFSVANCDDRLNAVLRLRVSPGGVREEALAYHDPEYSVIDDLFLRTLHDRDTSDIAAPEAAARVKAALATVEKTDEECCGAVGDLGESEIVRHKGETSLVINARRSFHFSIGRRAGRLFVTAVDIGPAGASPASPRAKGD